MYIKLICFQFMNGLQGSYDYKATEIEKDLMSEYTKRTATTLNAWPLVFHERWANFEPAQLGC